MVTRPAAGRPHPQRARNHSPGRTPLFIFLGRYRRDDRDLILSTPIVLLIIGIIQTHRRAAPSTLVALGALTPAQALESLRQPSVIFTVLDLGAYATILTAAAICLWGHLPHSRHTPRSAVAASALAVTSLWRAVFMPIGALIAYPFLDLPTFSQSFDYIYSLYFSSSGTATILWVATFLTFTCSTALLAVLSLHRSATIARLLSAALGACALINVALIISHFWVSYGPMNYIIDPSLLGLMAPLLGLMVPVFSRSFRQWCDGTWTPPARTARAVAGRPTILARTFQPVGPDGRPLDQATIATLLPTTRLTFWISFFFGLFGLIPMLTANNTAKNLGVVTNAYNHAMIKGLLIGTATWTATTIAFYAIIFAALAGL